MSNKNTYALFKRGCLSRLSPCWSCDRLVTYPWCTLPLAQQQLG